MRTFKEYVVPALVAVTTAVLTTLILIRLGIV